MNTPLADSLAAASNPGRTAPPPPMEAQKTSGGDLKISVLSRNTETLKTLRDYLNTADAAIQPRIWLGETPRLAAMIDQDHPDVVLLEGDGTREAELDTLEQIVGRHPGLGVILICAQPTPAFLLRALRIGVREVLPLPLTREALHLAIGNIHSRRRVTQPPPSHGKIIALLPCKGGAGATFLATNLACCIAAEGKRVCLIDLNLHFGEASLYVSESAPPSTVADVLQQIHRLDGPLLESSMLRVVPNCWLLAAPESPEKAVDIRPEDIERLLNVARSHYDFVLLDISRTLDANAIRALDHADDIYLVLQMTLPFLRDAARLMRLFRSLSYPENRLHVLVNRFEKGGDIDLKEVESGLRTHVSRTFPNSFGAVAVSINQGRPIIEQAPQDAVARALRDMARELAQVPARPDGWLSRLLRRKPSSIDDSALPSAGRA